MVDEFYVLNTSGLSSEDFGGEMVAVNFETGQYFGINGSAVAIWTLLHKPVSKSDIADCLKATYVSLSQDLEKDVDAFIEVLNSHNLLISGAKADLAALEQDVPNDVFQRLSGTTYVPPRIEVYSDLQELILLDPVHEVDPERGWPLRREDLSAIKPESGET